MNHNGTVTLGARRPRWWHAQPDLPLDCRAVGPDKQPLIKAVLDAAELLTPGRTLSFRLDYEPILLYRVLDQKGFEHWSEPQNDGQWRIDVCLPSGKAL